MASAEIRVPQNVKSQALELVVLRCGCGNPDGHRGRPCPRPASRENLQTVSYYHRNWLLRTVRIISIRIRDWMRNRGWVQVPIEYDPAPWDSDPELEERIYNALRDRWAEEKQKVEHLPEDQVRAYLEDWLKRQPEVKHGGAD